MVLCAKTGTLPMRSPLRHDHSWARLCSVGHGHQQIEGLQRLPRVGIAESTLENVSYVAVTIDAAESAIDGQSEVLIATGQRQRIRLDRQVRFGEPQVPGSLALIA